MAKDLKVLKRREPVAVNRHVLWPARKHLAPKSGPTAVYNCMEKEKRSLNLERMPPTAMECTDDVLPEVPGYCCALSDETHAVTEKIIRVLASHNPRLRPRYDRFDVNIAFRPCSDMDFDPSEFQYSRPSSSCMIQSERVGNNDSYRNFVRSSSEPTRHMDSALNACSRELSELHRSTSTTSETHIVSPSKRCLIARLLGCLGTSCAAD